MAHSYVISRIGNKNLKENWLFYKGEQSPNGCKFDIYSCVTFNSKIEHSSWTEPFWFMTFKNCLSRWHTEVENVMKLIKEPVIDW
jgi:hypothetical protein